MPVVSHVVQLFLEPYTVSEGLTLFEAFCLSSGYFVHPFYDMVVMKQEMPAMTWHDLLLCKTPGRLMTL